MVALRRILLGLLALSSIPALVRGEDSLPAEMVQHLKDSTVYIKTEFGPLKMTGTGFVIDVNGNTALIATNQHVVARPKELRQGSYIPGLRGRDRLALMRIQQALASAVPSVSVVFNSGDPNEQTIKAELVGELEEPDLAILKVSGINSAPQPINFRQTTTPFETMNVFIVGFPFGDALATNKGNPNVTIGKGSVSSIRKDEKGTVAKIQIDGALNPGNSGGPVVDAKGTLMGVAVQTIQGSNIGLAIPSIELASVLEGRVGTPTVAVGKTEKGTVPSYEVSVPMIDPMKKLKSVSVRFVDGAVPLEPKKSEPQFLPLTGKNKIGLVVGDRAATANLPLAATTDQKAREVTVQAEYVNAEGKAIVADPVVIKVAAPQTTNTTVTKDGNSTTVTQTTQNPNGTTSRRTVTISKGRPASDKSNVADADDDNDDEKMAEEKVASKTPGKGSDKSKTAKTNEGDDEPEEKRNNAVVEFGWTNKLSKMKKIPDEEVTGKIDGVAFRLDKAALTNIGLQLEMTPGFRGVFSEAKLDIRLGIKPNEDISGRKIIINGEHRFGDPTIFASSMRKGDKIPNTQIHNDYLMVLEFGEYNAEDRMQPGKIYVCFPDRGKSFLVGAFEAAVR